METASYFHTLSQVGLKSDQVYVYEALIKQGPMPAGRINQITPLKRGLVYKVLTELESLGLVTKKFEAGKVTIFEPCHPVKLQELAREKEKQAKVAQIALEGQLPALISEFNLASGRPGVRVFEGLSGVQEVLKDSLTAKEEICSYADIETIVKYFKEINEKFVKARERLGVKKRFIIIDTPFNREYLKNYHTNVTNTRWVKLNMAPTKTIMDIYDDKISYISYGTEKLISVIIQDPQIYQLHKWIFEWAWGQTSEKYTT